jgi:hypothetical protein
VTFKDLKRIVSEKQKHLDDKVGRLWPEESGNGHNKNDGINYWKGKKILSLDIWRKLGNITGCLKSLEYFPDRFFNTLLTYSLSNSGDPIIRERYDAWYSDFLELMEYKQDPGYGKEKCAQCLLSPDRENAAIFIGINKVMSRSLDIKGKGNTQVYPCPILNRFECPYDKERRKDEYPSPFVPDVDVDVDHLFYLSELAFAVELAMSKAQEQKEGVTYRIRTAQDAYNVLTDRRSLEIILEQGSHEEHRQYKDKIIVFLMNMKDKIDIDDLTVYPPPMYPSPS